MYNVEKYIMQCVDSIINQTLKDIEIILVDDESPDNCGRIADEYAKKDDRIKVIHQKNKWLGGARNAGLKIATGEYIVCIDADDYVAANFCEKLYDFSKKHNTDITIYGLTLMSFDGKSFFPKPEKSEFIYKRSEIEDIVYKKLVSSHEFNFNVCFFSRKIVEKGFLFDEDIRYAEDYEAALRVYKIAESVGYCGGVEYFYRQNDASIMHIIKFERLRQLIYLFELRENFIKENALETKENLYNSAHLLVKLLIEKFPMIFKTKDKKYGESRKELKELFKNESLNEALKRISLKTLNMGLFGKICLVALKMKMPFMIIIASKKYKG